MSPLAVYSAFGEREKNTEAFHVALFPAIGLPILFRPLLPASQVAFNVDRIWSQIRFIFHANYVTCSLRFNFSHLILWMTPVIPGFRRIHSFLMVSSPHCSIAIYRYWIDSRNSTLYVGETVDCPIIIMVCFPPKLSECPILRQKSKRME